MTAVEEYYKTLIGIYGEEIPVICITPIWRGDSFDGFAIMDEFCKKVKAIARREAINVAKTHVDCELDPMPNDERKVIHQYLQDFKNVTTVSVGEGNKRHLCIKYAPEKKEEETEA